MLGESYVPWTEPQQLKVAPTTWAYFKVRHVQVYAVTLRSRLQVLGVIFYGEMWSICLRGGE